MTAAQMLHAWTVRSDVIPVNAPGEPRPFPAVPVTRITVGSKAPE
jgi:hypothetical protein